MTLNVEAMNRALDWLEANPDAHTKTALAKDAEGYEVSTLSPDAVCWCALGRYAVELHTDVHYLDDLDLQPNEMTPIWEINDDYVREGLKAEGIAKIRELINVSA